MSRNHTGGVNLSRALSLITAAAFATKTPMALSLEIAIEEIIVTAQKRAETVQDVPLGITAITSDDIADALITNTTDIVRLAPSLTVGQGNSRQNSGFSIRGVGTQVFSIGVENSVAVVIDDVSTVQAGQSLAYLADIERIEVLRGPQSTLFGKSASAGLIAVVTKAPAESPEGSIEFQATDDDQIRITGSASGPLSDRLRYRLSGHWDELDGYHENLTTGESVNEIESQGLRGKLRWNLTDQIDLDVGAYYVEDDWTCCNLSWREIDPDARLFGVVPGDVAEGITPSDDNREVRRDDVTVSNSENYGVNAKLVADIGEFLFTSISAGDNWQYDNVEDVDFSDVDVRGFFTGGAQSGGLQTMSSVKTDFVSQEFRLSSPIYDSYDYLIGFYYADAETDRTFSRNQDLAILPANWDATASTESIALFTHTNWRISDPLEISVGLRWNREEVGIDYVNNLAANAAAVENNESDSEWLANVSAQYFLADDVMLYARYAQGYKGQAYNVVTGFDQEDADNPVAPETSDSYEIGVRSSFWDKRLQLNGTLFHTVFEDYQAQNTDITPEGEFESRLRNVGEVETSGVEFEGNARVSENLGLGFGFTYLDTEITEFEGAPCYPGQTEEEGCTNDIQDLTGASLPNAPEWKYYLNLNYELELSALPFYGFFNASYNWQDDVHFGLANSPLQVQESYGVANLSVGIVERSAERYRFTLFVNNVFDETYANGLADVRALYGGDVAVVQNLPRDSERYYGMRVRLEF